MNAGFTESVVEGAASPGSKRWAMRSSTVPGLPLAKPAAERRDPGHCEVVLEGGLRRALVRLDPALPPEALEDAFRKLTRLSAPSPERNRTRMLGRSRKGSCGAGPAARSWGRRDPWRRRVGDYSREVRVADGQGR